MGDGPTLPPSERTFLPFVSEPYSLEEGRTIVGGYMVLEIETGAFWEDHWDFRIRRAPEAWEVVEVSPRSHGDGSIRMEGDHTPRDRGRCRGSLPQRKVSTALLSPDDVVLIQRAGLRWIADRAEEPGAGKLATVHIVVSEEGRALADGVELATPDHLVQFVEDSLGLRVRPFEEFANKGGSQMRDPETGEPAAVLQVSLPTVQGRNEGKVHVSFLRGGHWAEGLRCVAERAGEGWVMASCEQEWIS